MTKCVTVGCSFYLHTEEEWVMETLHSISSIEQGNDQESVSVAND
jgi:hypothetical protein